MKFYRYVKFAKYLNKIFDNKLTAIYNNSDGCIIFYKNRIKHNNKNAASNCKKVRSFYLNGNFCGDQTKFTKQSWRRFVKLKAFL